MNEMIALYMVCGVAYTYLESKTFDYSHLNELPGAVIALNCVQMFVHFLRVAVTWPSYVVEDFTIYCLNRVGDEEE